MKKVLRAIGLFLLTVVLFCTAVNLIVVFSAMGRILPEEKAPQADAILVLGASVIANSEPSPMLEDRILTGVDLYHAGAAPTIVMSGDHRRDDYIEVGVMRRCAVEEGVPEEDIVMDHAGISTYDSVRRMALASPGARVIIVTQRYHLYRAVFIARSMGLDAYGVASDRRSYADFWYNQSRECMARIKDFVAVILRPESSNIDGI